MTNEYIETQLNTEMQEVETLEFDQAQVAIYCNKKPIPDKTNEDSLGVFMLKSEHLVAVVADGMGGHKGAGKASSIAIETLSEQLKGFDGSEYDLRGAIFDAIELAQEKVQALKIGAGTTLTIATLSPVGLRIYNIGDSAAIHMNSQGGTKYRSFEYSVGGFQFVIGRIDEKSVGTEDDHHQLINYLGSNYMRIEVSSLRPWTEGDMVLLGSDGLFDNIIASELHDVLTSEMDVDERLRMLIEMSQDNMNHGNFRRAKPDDLSAILFC